MSHTLKTHLNLILTLLNFSTLLRIQS